MAGIIQLAPPAVETSVARLPERNAPAIRTDAVYVVFTSIDETFAASGPLALWRKRSGHRKWWPTRAEQWRRKLEAAGHFVVFVDTSTGENLDA